MENYKELDVWRKGMDLVELIYLLTKKFPPEEKFGLVSQMQRSAVSIPSNIAEGWGRGSTSEYIYFLRVAKGSLLELETQVLIAERLKYILNEQTIELNSKIDDISRMLSRLIKSLKNK